MGGVGEWERSFLEIKRRYTKKRGWKGSGVEGTCMLGVIVGILDGCEDG